ncbi:hypothetical protein GW17_00051313 [Ensete ventricosum]|nr:hypothetical protein GW17_00051313 [Ensete ventricosum]
MAGAPGWVRFGVSRAGTSGGFSREPLESVSAEEDLHKGLVRMGVPDVTPPMLKSPLSDSDVDVVIELMWVPMDWAGLLYALSFFPSPRRGASRCLMLDAGKALVDSQMFEYPCEN